MSYSLPDGLSWNPQHQKLYCNACYPAHTEPLWWPHGGVTNPLEDTNIKLFIEEHRGCKIAQETLNTNSSEIPNGLGGGE